MVNLVLLLLTAGFFTLTIAASLLTLYKRELAVNERVTRYFGENIRREEQDVKSKRRLFSGLIAVYWEKGTEYLNRKISRADKRKIDNLLRDAGYPFKTAIDFRLFQLVLAVGGGLAMALLFLPIVEAKTSGWMLVITVSILGYRLPIFYLGKKSKARIKEINKGMPDFFDTVNLLLEAGMGLDLALADVSRKMKGPIADEFIQTLEDMKLGMSRREAFYELRKRVPSDSFQSVINSLIQADQLGIGMAKVLRNLTIRIREQRKEAAREQAMKAPVKMLFPMVFFIFPALFIVILGPLVITLVTKGLGG
ncbi:tight adherence protein C [Mesobacillus persicus]|uniref:Tight adherence protein C n=1 Tax=Mesobacillus persicus TaxID=930146 RepID=A0A1H8CH08_9BACI|nr:type II secretion system F family protein [Mesobacillus persicus]SEM94335.1 tight adherence protein C [Mesobacillus persicus]